MSFPTSPEGSYDPSVNPSQEDDVSWSPVSLEDSSSPMTSTQTQRQLLPRPGTDVPEQIRPLSPIDSEDDENPYIPTNPKHLTLPLAPIHKIMKKAVPARAMITRKAKEDMERIVVEFIQFITSEAAENVLSADRSSIEGTDILIAMDNTGFENYAELLRRYLDGYRARASEAKDKGKQTAIVPDEDDEEAFPEDRPV